MKKIELLFGADRTAASRVPRQETGEFHLLRGGGAFAFRAERSLLEPRQLPPDRIAELARSTQGSPSG
jgi:hypothetical protein